MSSDTLVLLVILLMIVGFFGVIIVGTIMDFPLGSASDDLKIVYILRCPKCGVEASFDAEFCPQCGMKLPPSHDIADAVIGAVQQRLTSDRMKLEEAIIAFLSSRKDTADKPTSTEIFNVLSHDLTSMNDTDFLVKLKELVMEKRIEAEEGDDKRVHYYVR